jgi:isopenicillin N synthase-like dioxygenase
MFSHIPTLPDPSIAPDTFALLLREALAIAGAAYIPVTWANEETDLHHQLQTFFAFSELEKRAIAQQLSSPWQGVFIGLGEEQLGENQPDYKEVLDLNLEQGTYAQWARQRQQAGQARNPAQPINSDLLDCETLTSITQSLWQLFAAFQAQANHVLTAIENNYHQPPGSLVSQHGQNSTLRLLHYPPAPHLGLNAIRLGAHQDYSGITLLWQDTTGGLEILTPEHEWVVIEIPTGYIGVIASEVMQRWSGGTLHAAPHRVRIIEPHQINQSRYSIAFFCETNHGCVVYPGALLGEAQAEDREAIAIKTFLSEKYDQILANLSV